MPKEFEVGDKVKIPKTKSTGPDIKEFKKLLKDYSFDYLVIESLHYLGTSISLKRADDVYLKYSAFKLQDLEHYQESLNL